MIKFIKIFVLALLLPVAVNAEEPLDRYWACTGWDDTEYPDPFMLVHRKDGVFVMNDVDDEYQLHPDYIEEFLAEKDDMTVVVHLIDRRSGELDKEKALVLTQANNISIRRLEVIRIDNINTGVLDPFRRTDRTYCNMIE